MTTRMQQRRGNASEWLNLNPVLAPGEMGIELDTGVIKSGDGATPWNSLPTAFLTNRPVSVVNSPNSLAQRDGDGNIGFNDVLLAGQDTGASATRRDFVESLTLPTSPDRKLVTHFGDVEAFPVDGVRNGDRCYRRDLRCEMFYTGAAWRQTNPAEGTLAQRPISTANGLYIGFQYFETDTLFNRRWDGTRWEILGWRGNRAGTGTAVAGAMANSLPGMAANWTNAQIPNGTNIDYNNWTTVATLPAVYATAGDGGVPLIAHTNTAGRTFTCNAKGRVRVDLYNMSDHTSVGRSAVSIMTNANLGLIGWVPDVRHRNSGYAASGVLEQFLSYQVPVLPGDWFGVRIAQTNSTTSTVAYQTHLQVTYI